MVRKIRLIWQLMLASVVAMAAVMLAYVARQGKVGT